jgi:hypothetical protein
MSGRERLGPYSARVRSICREALIVGNCVKREADEKPIGSASAVIWALRNATATLASQNKAYVYKKTYVRQQVDKIYAAWTTLQQNGYLSVADKRELELGQRGRARPHSRQR